MRVILAHHVIPVAFVFGRLEADDEPRLDVERLAERSHRGSEVFAMPALEIEKEADDRIAFDLDIAQVERVEMIRAEILLEDRRNAREIAAALGKIARRARRQSGFADQ